MKILKIVLLSVLTITVILIGYVYSLTFQPEGRLDWGQALFLKLAGSSEEQIESLKKMSIEERSHFTDGVPFSLENLEVDTIKITPDSIRAFILKPKNLTGNNRVILYFHGGAFVLPWTTLSMSYATLLAHSFNAIVVGVDYRVAPEYPFPTPNNDCFSALLWTIQNIYQWGGNPNELILAGESAGATLATTTAIRANKEHIENVKYQILDCPVSYVPNSTEAYIKFKRGYFLEESFMVFGIDSYLPNSSDHTNPLAMPFYEDSLSNLAPAIVITSEFDPLRDTGRDYVKKLKEAQIPTQHIEMKGMLHNMPGPFNLSDRVKLYQDIAKKLNGAIQN